MYDRLVPIPDGTPSEFIKDIEEVCSARVSHLRYVPQSVATTLPRIRSIFGVASDAGLVIVDSGATETGGSPEALQPVLSAVQKVMPRSKVEINVGAGRAMTLKLADGSTTCAYSLVWIQTPHGWFRAYVIESTGIPMLLSNKGVRALQATIEFATHTVAYRCVNCSNESFAVERMIATSPNRRVL